MDKQQFIDKLTAEWKDSPRWKGVVRPYRAEDVYKLRGTIDRGFTFAKLGATRLWKLLNEEPYVHVLSALTGNQAIQQIKAGA